MRVFECSGWLEARWPLDGWVYCTWLDTSEQFCTEATSVVLLKLILNSSKTKGCSRNYPRGGVFFQTPPPPGHVESEPPDPWPPGHVSALINPPHYGSNTPWPPGQGYRPPTPTPRTHCQQNILHPQDKKGACGPPTPEDNFWNSPNAAPTRRLPYDETRRGASTSSRGSWWWCGCSHDYDSAF